MIHHKARKSKLSSWLNLGPSLIRWSCLILQRGLSHMLEVITDLQPFSKGKATSPLTPSRVKPFENTDLLWGLPKLALGLGRVEALPSLHHPNDCWAENQREEVAGMIKQVIIMNIYRWGLTTCRHYCEHITYIPPCESGIRLFWPLFWQMRKLGPKINQSAQSQNWEGTNYSSSDTK